MAASDPNETRPIKEIIEAEGYKFEAHSVTTDDGYILEIHRLFQDSSEGKPVIFLQHGILASSETFVLNGPNSSAYRFAKAGYDVWMGNNRGNIYSKKHVTLDPNDKNDQRKYFDFSFFELAEHDLPK